MCPYLQARNQLIKGLEWPTLPAQKLEPNVDMILAEFLCLTADVNALVGTEKNATIQATPMGCKFKTVCYSAAT